MNLALAQIDATLAQAAQTTAEPPAQTGVWWLFQESFDVFTVVLIVGSLVAVTLIVRLIMDTQEQVVAPKATVEKAREAIESGEPEKLDRLLGEDDGIVASSVRSAWRARERGRDAMRESAEQAGANACGRWTRPVDIVRTIGELGPLIGLAGTVWGMILAFVRLGEQGGSAGPTDLSMGISKALFHTLLGLVLAVPCVLSASLFRARLERLCNRAMDDALQLVDRLADLAASRGGDSTSSTGPGTDQGDR